MFRYNNQTKDKGFNDYVDGGPNGRIVEAHHGRTFSSKSVYSQNESLSRKKLTVVSRDGISPQFKGDYYMTHNGPFMNTQNRKNSYVPIKIIQPTSNSSQNKLQHYESLRNSIIKSKIQRPISPSPMSPTNVLRLKKFQNKIVPSIKIYQQSSPRSVLIPRNDLSPCKQPSGQANLEMIKSIRKQLLSTFNLKVLELQSKMQYQQETIKSLQSKINENNWKLKQKEKIIDELLRDDRERTKSLFDIKEKQVKKRDIGKSNEDYLLKRMKDVESKFKIFLNEEQQFKTFQQIFDQKLAKLQYELITINSSKLSALKNQLDQFLQQKSQTLSSLSESISYLDKRLIGRTQAIKELLCQLKLKVKQVEDSWTQKETKTTKQSLTLESRQNFTNSPTALQGSLQFSVTSYEADDQNRLNNLKNIYYDYNEISDLSLGLENSLKNDCSKLTDDFYYPGGIGQQKRDTLRDISPIVNRSQQKEQQPKSSTQTVRPTFNNIKTTQSNEINKKFQCIQELIQTKKLILNQERQKGQLRCYIDKTGYLKYTDSRTFVFDKKGNLIPLTEREFQLFVTKGLIHDQKDEQDSKKASYISSGL